MATQLFDPRPILVGYDPATRDRAPVRFGLEAARITGAPLVVACVALGDGGRRGTSHVDEELVHDAGDALAEIHAELEGEDVELRCGQLRGTSAAEALHAAALREDAALLVVGSKIQDGGPLDRVVPGTTAQRLLHGAPCAVTLVPPGWAPHGGVRTIGVGFVDTEEGHEALRAAHGLARRTGASLRVITVVRPRLAWYAETEPHAGVRPHKEYDEVAGEHRVQAEQALQEAVAGLGDDVPVQAEALLGDDPAEVLAGISEHLDMLVCGSRGYGPLRAVLLGGVSRRVITEARCPVLVLPRGVRLLAGARVLPVAEAWTPHPQPTSRAAPSRPSTATPTPSAS
jgi:nucleotide-binding universal stress UspA family protein